MNVENIEFDQSQMRSDPFKCFINRRLQTFPILETFTCRTQLLFLHREIVIFCPCLMPETYADMVECDSVTNGSILVVLELNFLQLKLNNGAFLHCYVYVFSYQLHFHLLFLETLLLFINILPGSPYYQEYGDPGPYFTWNMGTRGP